MNGLFNDDMSYAEAQKALFRYAAGKPTSEIERIKAEYYAIIDKITKRELRENAGCLTSNPV